jgi:hypothetical protein
MTTAKWHLVVFGAPVAGCIVGLFLQSLLSR